MTKQIDCVAMMVQQVPVVFTSKDRMGATQASNGTIIYLFLIDYLVFIISGSPNQISINHLAPSQGDTLMAVFFIDNFK